MRALVLAFVLAAGCGAQGLPDGQPKIHFYSDVQSDIQAHCIGCHDPAHSPPAGVPVLRADDTEEIGANYGAIMKLSSDVGMDADRMRHHFGDADLWRAWVSDGAIK